RARINGVITDITDSTVISHGDRIVLDAEAATPTETAHLTLPIAQRLATDPATYDAPPLPASDALPLRLPVFRIAHVAFTQTETRTEWTVLESKWVKTKKPN
ncbi:MAG: hypothetical protein K2J14_00665, partial [Treponemataceae bacterium]|nr:hypothetical protein [Treponemataceae bacterium]